MTPAEAELWQRIAVFEFDDAGAALPFSARLAAENRWSPEFAACALEEYRRFAFLAVAAGHPVSPSDVVDQVWHEHLVYTRSYWERFCRDVLRQPLHHEPTRGGAGERAKFDDWYSRTLASYRRFFGEPPRVFWPTPGERAAAKNRRISVDASRYWLLPKLRWRPVGLLALAMAPLVFFGCAALKSVDYNPLELAGPDFLRFWFGLAVLAVVAALFLRWALRGVGAYPLTSPISDPVDVALLAGGPVRAVQAAVATLFRGGALEFDAGALSAKGVCPKNATPLERRIFERCREARVTGFRGLRAHAASALAPRQQEMIRAGLLLDDSAAGRIRVSVLGCLAIPLVLGVVKIGVGAVRGRPVGFLILGTLGLAFVTFLLGRNILRTRTGDAVLSRLRHEHDDLQPSVLAVRTTRDVTSTALAVALYGAAVLPALGMPDLRQFIAPASTNTSSSGCSSSGCGGGGGVAVAAGVAVAVAADGESRRTQVPAVTRKTADVPCGPH